MIYMKFLLSIPVSLVLSGVMFHSVLSSAPPDGPPVVPIEAISTKIQPRRVRLHRKSVLRASIIRQIKRRHWLAQLVQAEAGDQTFYAKLAVADVVVNRIKSMIFPSSLLGVILQPGQFSTVSNGTFYDAIPTQSDLVAAKFALAGWNIVPNRLYFFSYPLPSNSWMYSLTNCVWYDQMDFCSGPSSS